MKYSVVLQDPFDFEPFWLWLGIGLLAAAAAIWLIRFYLKRRMLSSSPHRKPHPLRALGRFAGGIRLFLTKEWFLRMIRKIERDFRQNRIDSREAHQRIAGVVRLFAQTASHWPVTRMAFSEIHRLGCPQLTGLIGRFQEPEFGRIPREDIRDLAEQSKELIRRWK